MGNELCALALTRLDGSSDSLAQRAGKVQLVVNVALRCGLAPADGLLCNTMSSLIMILRHLPFFTESARSAVISLTTHPTRSHVLR